MTKSKELHKISKLVKDILEKNEAARNSDMLLYLECCKRINAEAISNPFMYVIGHLKELGLPNTETVRRARQKIQEENEELRASADVEAHRLLNEEAFENFAKGVC